MVGTFYLKVDAALCCCDASLKLSGWTSNKDVSEPENLFTVRKKYPRLFQEEIVMRRTLVL